LNGREKKKKERKSGLEHAGCAQVAFQIKAG